ncbi:MAG TPA: calcium/proton exchanger [Gemmatimonadales bacterium]|jgi:Ca2+:H+ antiporter|nr:calcium/proton exchanger [Gemmatimonadales bacterium]
MSAGSVLRVLPLALIPISLALDHLDAPPAVVFLAAAVAIVPLADWIRKGTEQVAATVGAAIGGLLNVTLGNAAELILALFVLAAGKPSVVKATITGSIVGNSLLGLGLAIVVGSWGRERQSFHRERAGLLGTLLIISVIALLVPALFDYTERHLSGVPSVGDLDERLSLGVAVVLILAYGANLVYTLVTHRDIFGVDDEAAEPGAVLWPLWQAFAVLAAATAAVAFEAELVAHALEGTAQALGLTPFFLGVIVLPLAGNAAEYFAAVYFARRNRMDLVMTIAVGSSIQIALLTAPLLVLVAYALGTPMDLVFSNPLELVAVAAVAFVVNSITQDGETTWLEGALLLAVYAVLGLAFFFVR